MSENIFKPGDIVKHVYFADVKLYVIKKLENGSYKCRYQNDISLVSDEFDEIELIKDMGNPGLGIRAMSGV